MQFLQYGSAYQLRIESPDDLVAALTLDDALWAATSAPVGAFRCERRFLDLLDRDGSGRITSDEVRAAIRWLLERLADRRCLFEPFTELPLSALANGKPQTQALVRAAEYVVRDGPQTDAATAPALTLERIRDCMAYFNRKPFNGDGVIVPEAASDPEVAQFIADIVACTGGTLDAGGKQGVTLAQTNEFCAAVKAFLDWDAQGLGALAEGRESPVLPFGRETPDLYALFARQAQRMDEYFEWCRMLRYDPALAPPRAPAVPGDAGAEAVRRRLATDPLAKPRTDGVLPLAGDAVNPLYADDLLTLRDTVLRRCLPQTGDTLTADAWQEVRRRFKPYAQYVAERKGACAERLARERLRLYTRPDLAEQVKALITRDLEVADIRRGIEDIERLWLFATHLPRLANNFISFSHLYSLHERALFERGSAVIDGRWFNLALKTEDVNAHATVARTGNIFTIYLEVERLNGDGKFTVALPATHGTRGNVREGKRGIFFDVDGREYDARVVRIIENPISLREALISPLWRLRDFVVGKIESISGANEKELQKSADAFFQSSAAARPTPTAPATPPAPAGLGPAGLFMGLGVATAALGTAFAYISKTVIGMSPANRLLSLLGALAVVFVPVALVAVMKLRSQDLSSLLEACGWAVNARLRLSRAQRGQFTRKAPFPEGAGGTPERRWVFRLLLTLALLAALTGVVVHFGGCLKKDAPPLPPAAAAAQP